MVIEVSCPNCQKEYRIDDDKAGRKFRCKDCQAAVDVPTLEVDDDDEDEFGDDYGDGYSDDDDDDFEKPFRSPSRSRSQRRGRSRSGVDLPIAGLGQRFLGAMIDMFAAGILVGPAYAMLLYGVSIDEQGGDGSTFVMIGVVLLAVGVITIMIAQIYLLATKSQSIGKWVMNTQIHDYETREPAGFVKTFVLRLLVNRILGGIPCIGGIYAIVDILFIFGDEHRCVHDMLANTYVVDLS